MVVSRPESAGTDIPVYRPRVLFIDHNRTIATTAAITLKTAGYDVIQAADGAEGLAYARDCFPDIVILDICHLQARCLAFPSELRRLRPENKPSVLATSIFSVSRGALKANGIVDFIQKPYDVRRLLNRVNECIQ